MDDNVENQCVNNGDNEEEEEEEEEDTDNENDEESWVLPQEMSSGWEDGIFGIPMWNDNELETELEL